MDPASVEANDSKYDSSSSSEASLPAMEDSYVPFQPKFAVKVTEPVKNGDIVQYTVKTTRLIDGCDFSVTRQYDDFEYLHHGLLTQINTSGIIMPPLPPKPMVEAKAAENRSKKQLGSTSKTLIGDEFHKDCRSLERYLQLVIAHTILGQSTDLEQFLLQKQAPVGAKVKLGVFGKLMSAAEEARKSSHVDIDDYFQRARESANTFSVAIHQAARAFNQVVHSQQRISLAYAQVSTALSSCNISFCEDQANINKLLGKFSEAIDDAKHGLDVEVTNDENTLGFWLDLHARYSVSVKEMLFRRTCLLINYEDSNRALDKAKPAKRYLAEEAQVAAAKEFEHCSEVAQRELAAYQRQQRHSLQEVLCVYADAKIKTARDTVALLAHSLTYFRQLDTASSHTALD